MYAQQQTYNQYDQNPQHAHNQDPNAQQKHISALQNAYTPRNRASGLRSQSTPDGLVHSSRPAEAQNDLPLDKLPSRIRGIVVRLDEDIAKISTYIQQVPLADDQLNRYQRHLRKLVARRGQYAIAESTTSKLTAHHGQQSLDAGGAAGAATATTASRVGAGTGNDDNRVVSQAQQPGSNAVTVGLRHTNSLQQLEHKDYYNKQLEKMIANATSDPKFSTYVDYYKQKLKAVEKRQQELEAKLNREGHNTTNVSSPKTGEEIVGLTTNSAQKEGDNKHKASSIIDVISDQNKSPGPGPGVVGVGVGIPQQPVIAQPQNDNNNAGGDAFADIMDLGSLGYTAAAPSKPVQPFGPHMASLTPQTQPKSYDTQQAQPGQGQVGDPYSGYLGLIGGAAGAASRPGQQPVSANTRQSISVSHQKQKLKQYIRQHALKYVKPPPDPSDATYPEWCAGLRKVESIIYAKYMNKQRKRMQEALARQQAQGGVANNPNMPDPAQQTQARIDSNNPTQNPSQATPTTTAYPDGYNHPQTQHQTVPGAHGYPPSQRSPSNPGNYPPRTDPSHPATNGPPSHTHQHATNHSQYPHNYNSPQPHPTHQRSPNVPPQQHSAQGQYPPQSSTSSVTKYTSKSIGCSFIPWTITTWSCPNTTWISSK